MNKKIKNKSFINDLIFTYVSQFLLTVFHVVIIKLFAKSLTESDFGAYMVIKRFVALSFPIVTLKLGMSLSKFIGSNIKKRTVYYFLSFFILSGLMILILIFSLVFKEPIAMLLFNNVRYKAFIIPMLLFLFISSLQVLTTGYFRGKHDFFLMNLNVILFWTIQLIVVVIVSLVEVNSFHKLFYFYIYSSIGAFILYTYLILQDTDNIFRKIKNFINEGIISKIKNNYEYIKYGIIRLPNGFFVAGISAIPVFYASNRISLKSAGYIGAIVTIMRMFQLIGTPFNKLFLPKFSHKNARGESSDIKNSCETIVEFIFTFPMLLGIVIYYIAPELILLWFGEEYAIIIDYLYILSPFLGLAMIFILVRSILNGLYEYPYTFHITLSSFMVVLVIIVFTEVFSFGLTGVVIAHGIGIILLGIISLYVLLRKQEIKFFTRNNLISIFWLILSFIALNVFKFLINIDNLILSLGIKMLISSILMGISYILYNLLNFQWVEELKERIKYKSIINDF